jgi:hypothetical protein
MDMQFNEIYALIQSELKAPKSQYNSFAKYNYRSCEDILEAVKPILTKYKVSLTISDEVVLVGDRFYIKATASLSNGNQSITSYGFAREPEQKKGLDESQITGMASSYARKYALNGLFCIDDTKDADTMDNSSEGKATPDAPKAEKKEDDRPWMSEKNLKDIIERINGGDMAVVDLANDHYRMKKEYREKIVAAVREYKQKYNQL